MEFNCLQEHQDEILEFMRSHDYTETYVQRYRTTIKQITDNAGRNNWQSYEDVYRWYCEKPYSPSYLRGIKAILGKLELFHLHGLLPDGKKSLSSLRKVKPAYTKLNEEYSLLYDSFESRISQGLKESTVSSYRTKITSFLLDLQNLGCDRLSAVTETAVLSCILNGEERKRNASVCSRLAYFFRLLSESGNSEAGRILHYIPPMRFARKNIDYLTDEEILSIREALVDTNNGYIALFHGDHPSPDSFLFYSGLKGKNYKLSQPAIAKMLKKYALQGHDANPEVPVDLHAHQFRHAKASHWLEDGMNIVQISFLLGHAQLQTTMLYLDITSEQEARAMATLEDEEDKKAVPKWKKEGNGLSALCGLKKLAKE